MYCRIFSMRFFSCKSFNAITKEIREILSNFRAHNKHYHRFLIRIVFRMKILCNARMNDLKPENSNTLCTFFYNYILLLEQRSLFTILLAKTNLNPFLYIDCLLLLVEIMRSIFFSNFTLQIFPENFLSISTKIQRELEKNKCKH